MSLLHRHALKRVITAAPPEITLEFHAIAPDGSEIMQDVLVGTGGLTEARVANIWLPDYEGVHQEFGANEPGYIGGRVTGAVGSRVVYANDGVNPLAEMPYVSHAPQAKNLFSDSDLNNWLTWKLLSANPVVLSGFDGVRAIPDTSTDIHMVYITGESADKFDFHHYSFIAKAAGYDGAVIIPFSSNPSNYSAGFDLTNGTVIGHGANITSADIEDLGNGIFRCSCVIYHSIASVQCRLAPAPVANIDANGEVINFAGDGVSGVDFAMPQFEYDSVTPPIPTFGAPVTRDACALSFNSANHSDTIGAYYAEFDLIGDSDLLDGFLFLVDPNAILSDGTNSATLAAAIGQRKIGCVYGDGNMELNVDGVWSTQSVYDGTLLQGALDLFRTAAINGKARNIQRWDGNYADLRAKIDELMT